MQSKGDYLDVTNKDGADFSQIHYQRGLYFNTNVKLFSTVK